MKGNGELGRIYGDKEVIFREGERGEVMYVIQSGKVRITKKGPSGDHPVATLESGEIFGEMALFDRLPRSATATAQGETRILSIDKNKLFSTIGRDPTLVFKLIESMSRRIRSLNEYLIALSKNQGAGGQSSSTMEETYRMILKGIQEVVEADNGSIMILDEHNVLAVQAAFGQESPEKMRFSWGEGIAGQVLSTGRPELINHVSLDRRFVPGSTHVESLICVPLRSQEKQIGVINISSKSGKVLTDRDLKVLHSISLYASLAIESARNFIEFQSMTNEAIRQTTLWAI